MSPRFHPDHHQNNPFYDGYLLNPISEIGWYHPNIIGLLNFSLNSPHLFYLAHSGAKYGFNCKIKCSVIHVVSI